MNNSSIALTASALEELELLQEILARRQSRQRLINFTQYTNNRYEAAWFHHRMADKLDAVERGEIKRLLIMAPPRHGKSELATRRFVAKYLGRHPDHDVISASYGQDLALDFSRDIRSIIRTQQYKALFPTVSLAPDSQAINRWHVRGQLPDGSWAQGGFIAAGVGTAITGRGAHLLNLDDLMKDRAEAESEQTRKTTWDWYRGTAYTRLMPNAAIVATMTRWHEEDPMGMILVQMAEHDGEQWELLVLPAINPVATDDLPAYEALWPERYSPTTLNTIRNTIGEYDWNALYMQRPRPPGGSFFTVESLLENGQPVEPLDDYGNLGSLDYVVPVIDTALKTGKEHDGCAVTYLGVARHAQVKYQTYILDWDYKQIEGALLAEWLPSVFTRCEELVQKYRCNYGMARAQIEDKGSGTVLLQQAFNAGWPAMAIESGLTAMGKAERAFNVSNYVHAGNCKFTPHAFAKTVTFKGITKNHLLTQILNFRAGTQETAPDDCLDTWTYGLALVIGNYLGF